jgi:hypothetical protein
MADIRKATGHFLCINEWDKMLPIRFWLTTDAVHPLHSSWKEFSAQTGRDESLRRYGAPRNHFRSTPSYFWILLRIVVTTLLLHHTTQCMFYGMQVCGLLVDDLHADCCSHVISRSAETVYMQWQKEQSTFITFVYRKQAGINLFETPSSMRATAGTDFGADSSASGQPLKRLEIHAVPSREPEACVQPSWGSRMR